MSIAKKLALAAAATFAYNAQVNELLVCEDGNAFVPEAKNAAVNHCKQFNLPEPVVVTREDVSEELEQKFGEIAKASKAEKDAADKAAAATKAADKKAAVEKEAEEKVAAEKEAADKEAEEKVAADTKAAEKKPAKAKAKAKK